MVSPLPLYRFIAEYGEIEYGGFYRYFFIYRGGCGICVRPHRYALARWLTMPLGPVELGLHECDRPLCVEVCAPGAVDP